jgi:hypothetical protein
VAPYWNGFGDLWAVASHCCLLAQREHRPVQLSKWSSKADWDRGQELRQILACFDPKQTRGVELCDERCDDEARFGVREHLEPYVQTGRRWAPSRSRVIAYQIHTHTTHLPDRFCDPGLMDRLRSQMPGFEFVEIGKKHQRTLAEIVAILAGAACFVGIDSGMSHVAHSVGVPTFLKHHAELHLAHPGKEYVAFADGHQLSGLLAEHLRRPRWRR